MSDAIHLPDMHVLDIDRENAARAGVWLMRGSVIALAAIGLLAVIIMLANAREPYGGPLEA